MLLPSPSPRASLAKLIADTLRAEIFSGSVSPGEPIVELALAARFETSRAPVREAMSKLTAEGLLHLKPNGRTVVCPLEQKDFLEILDTRSALESMAARRAAPHWTNQDSEVVREIIGRQRNSRTLAELSQLDVEMHTFMVSRSGNGRLFGLWQQIRGQFSVCLAHTHRTQTALAFDPKSASVQLHLELLEAFESRNGETAAAAAGAHVEIWGNWLSRMNLPAPKKSRKSHGSSKRRVRVLPLLFLGFLGCLGYALQTADGGRAFLETKIQPLRADDCAAYPPHALTPSK
jgi:DNA-binding GntR family transcriptional regulator